MQNSPCIYGLRAARIHFSHAKFTILMQIRKFSVIFLGTVLFCVFALMIVYVSLNNQFPFISQYAVVHKDGTKLNSNRRQITASGTEQSVSGKTSTFEKKFIIGDDGIGHLQHTPKPDGQFITIEVWWNYSVILISQRQIKSFVIESRLQGHISGIVFSYNYQYISQSW